MSLADGNMGANCGKQIPANSDAVEAPGEETSEHPKTAEIIDFAQHLRLTGRKCGPSENRNQPDPSLYKWWPRFGKRLFDIVFSAIGIFVFLPAFLLIALAVKLSSPGPVFYRQLRFGRNGQTFQMIKFRTMSTSDGPGTVIFQTRFGDNRVFPIGRFLRRTSFDELPQLFNVLRGDMSIVGPRPHAPLTAVEDTYFEEIASEPQYRCRFDVRPGITGLAQVSGSRGPVLTRECARRRLGLDAEYVRRQSLRTDARILLRTIAREFISGKAH
jgi:lipopolysaccharide/colanic/teichoic acid biosynthesis glycosyltransferase